MQAGRQAREIYRQKTMPWISLHIYMINQALQAFTSPSSSLLLTLNSPNTEKSFKNFLIRNNSSDHIHRSNAFLQLVSSPRRYKGNAGKKGLYSSIYNLLAIEPHTILTLNTVCCHRSTRMLTTQLPVSTPQTCPARLE